MSSRDSNLTHQTGPVTASKPPVLAQDAASSVASVLWQPPASFQHSDPKRFSEVLRFGAIAPEEVLRWAEDWVGPSNPSGFEGLLGNIGRLTQVSGLVSLRGASEVDQPVLERLLGLVPGDASSWLDPWHELDVTLPMDEAYAKSRDRVDLSKGLSLEDPRLPGLDEARSLLYRAVEAFNHGSTPRANQMLLQADEVIRRGFHDRRLWQALRGAACEGIDLARLFEVAKTPGSHPYLRDFLRSFPQWQVQPLLRRLALEKTRGARRRVLTLLTIHGWETRKEAADRLVTEATSIGKRLPWYLTRNLIFLLRSLQEGQRASDYELAGVLSFADLDQPSPVLQEAIGYLGAIDDKRSEKRLLSLLETLEGRRLGSRSELKTLHQQLVDRLLRRPSEGARLRALESLKGFGGKGSFAAVECLGHEDLSGNPQLTRCLIDMLREQDKGRWLKRRTQDISAGLSLIRSLAATDTPEVRAELERVSNRSRRSEFRQLAQSTLQRLDRTKALAILEEGAAPSHTSGLSGDIGPDHFADTA